MARNNNTYGELINNKFSDLLSANSTKTWPAMKDLLDMEMPEKKKRKWLIWFTTKTGIVAIVIFSLIASAAGSYINHRQQNEKNDDVPVKEMTNEVIQKKNDLKNAPPVNKDNSQEKISIHPEIKTKISLAYPVKINERRQMQASETHKGKASNLPVTDKDLICMVQIKDTLTKSPAITPITLKDSVQVPEATLSSGIVERKRAF